MRLVRRVVAAGLPVVLASLAACATSPVLRTSDGCDRGCLLDVATRYADALTAHTFDEVAIDPALRSTENAAPLAVDAGVARSATGWRYRHTVVDAERGQILIFGTVAEGDTDAMLAIRLRIAARRVVESERLVARAADSRLFAPRASDEIRPLFDGPVDRDHRSTRETLVAVANRYFDAISAGDPAVAAFHPDCNRYENGVRTTNQPPRFATSCSEGIRRLVYMREGRERRFPLVDVDRGLVLGIVAFDLPSMNEVRTIRGQRVEFSDARQLLPRTIFLYELFRIDEGRIRAIEAVMIDRPLGDRLGWP